MKTILLLGPLMLLTICSAGAQASSPGQPSGIGPAATLRIDSVAVLRQVFRQNRRGSRLGTLSGGYEGVIGVNALGSNQSVSKVLAGPLIGIGITNAVLSIVRWSRYSQRREAAAVLRHSQPLPRYVQKPYIAALGQVKKYLR